MAVPVSNEERLFSLVLALLATETGLTKADMLSSVQGYRQRYRPGGNNASLERQFERDKEDVRDLGVPLESIELPADQGASQYTRYRIPKGAYDLPADVTFTPQEIALLNLAALAWREGSLSGESRRALMKLRSLGIDSDEPLLGYAPRLRARDAAFDPLSGAIERHHLVRFGYLKPGDTQTRRRQRRPARPRAVRRPLARARHRPALGGAAHVPAQPDRRARRGDLDRLPGADRRSGGGCARLAPRGDRPERRAGDRAAGIGRRRPSRHGAPSPPTRGGSRCTTRTCRSSPTSSRPSAPRCSCTSPPPWSRPSVSGSRPSPPPMEAPMADAQPQRVQDRLAFLLALVPYLLDNDGVSVGQAAAHFHVPEQRIREAVELIAVSGVPGDSRQYQHGDLFDIDWDRFETDDEIAITHQVAIDDSPRFSAREAAALIAGLQYLSALPENADRATIATLTAKLTRAAATTPAAVGVEGEADDRLGLVRTAIAGSAVLRFDYLNGRGLREERAVEPLRVESVDESWYLRAWDRSRSALRTFRLDRMAEVRIDPDAEVRAPRRPRAARAHLPAVEAGPHGRHRAGRGGGAAARGLPGRPAGAGAGEAPRLGAHAPAHLAPARPEAPRHPAIGPRPGDRARGGAAHRRRLGRRRSRPVPVTEPMPPLHRIEV